MAYEKLVSVPSAASSGQIPKADGNGGYAWGTIDLEPITDAEIDALFA